MKKLILMFTLFFSLYSFSQYSVDDKLNNFIIEWIGKPYRFGGTNKKGIDCSAFTQKLYKEVYNIEIPRTCSAQYKMMENIKLEELEVGDILFFSSKTSPSGWHCGVYIGYGEFVHSSNYKEGVKISCVYDEPYNRIFKSGGRIKI